MSERRRHFLSDHIYNTRKFACDIWPVDPADPEAFKPVVSDIPTLLISGHFDPTLPPETGTEIVKTLSNSRHIVVPFMSHMLGDLSNVECYDAFILAYFDGREGEIDVDCFREMRPGDFKVTSVVQ